MAEYFEREAAVKAFNNFDAGRADSPPCTLLTPEEFAEYLYELPTADVAPVVHGRWNIMKGTKTRRICSKCGWDVPEYGKFYSYCPNCGARMDIQDGGDNDAVD